MPFRTPREERLDKELRLHLQEQVDSYMAAGMTREDAERRARLEFGGVEQVKEDVRESRRWFFFSVLGRDVRFGLRMLRKNPGFTAVAVLSLALGIGANTAIFTLIDAVLLRMLPVKNPQELVSLNIGEQETAQGTGRGSGFPRWTDGNSATAFSYTSFARMRERSDVFSSVFAFKRAGRLNTQVDGNAELAAGQLVTANYFSTLGVPLVLGRDFMDEDDHPGAAPVAIISYGYWERRFGSDRSAVGRTIAINGVSFQIVGVTAPEFYGLQEGSPVDLSVPIATQPRVLANLEESGVSLFTAADHWWVEIMGRLKPGVTEQQAHASLDVIFKQSLLDSLSKEKDPFTGPMPVLQIVPGSRGLQGLRNGFSKPLFILMTVVGVVLLIACANVANLLLARATERRKEIAVRLAMGATRSRLVRQLLIESMLLSSLGALAGLLFAYWGSSLLVTMMQSGNNHIVLDLHPDLRVLAFTAGVGLLTGLLFGLAPALRGTRVDLTSSLKQSSGSKSGIGRMGLTKSLVVSQVALSLVLLFGAGLFVRTLVNLQTMNVGFTRDNLLLFGIAPREAGYKGVRYANLCRDIQRRLAALPGVKSATSSLHLLLSGSMRGNTISVPGYTPAAKESMSVQVLPVGTDFLPTMGIALLQGRDLTAHDDENAPKVALINQKMAQKYWPGQNPVGRHFTMGKLDLEVVGVVQDAKYNSLRRDIAPVVYHPYVQNMDTMPHMHFEVRTAGSIDSSGDAAALIPAVREVVRTVDSRLPLFDVSTQTQQIDDLLLQERLFAKLTAFFSALALTLVCVGLYGMMSYTVSRRTSEIGIRMALGARRGSILGMVLRDVLRLAAIGVTLGIGASLATAKLADAAVAGLLFGLKTSDTTVIVIAALLMTAVALLAGFLPARRASRVEPMVALRYE
jgi:predicted permease